MFFLLRMAFWFSLVLLALPLGAPQDGSPAVGPLQAIAAAKEAVGDLAGLCERKPQVCETGLSAAHTVAARARETGRIALELMEDEEVEATDVELVTGTVEAQP